MQSLWMLVAAALFALMGAGVKLASTHYAVSELVFFRSLVSVVMLLAYARVRGGVIATPVPWMHLRRGAVGVASLALWFYATTLLPLGTAMTLNYTSPLFLAAALTGFALAAGRRIDHRLLAAVVAGFVGVALTLQPSFDRDHAVPALGGLLSGALSAVAYWHVRELGQLGEPEWRTVFYFSLTGTLLGGAAALVNGLAGGFSAHTPRSVALLLGVGTSATLAQLAMTRAYARGRPLLTASLQYAAIVFASLLGVLVFDDRLPVQGWVGIGIILCSGLAATLVTRARNADDRVDVPGPPLEEPFEPAARPSAVPSAATTPVEPTSPR
jgi:S-adenosylmethionine uptake transporter